jgi:bifunctional UDP-N-acetylglucosamine pyrophosphorylase / glucosamine-1-phosphate N-acetyltransferase
LGGNFLVVIAQTPFKTMYSKDTSQEAPIVDKLGIVILAAGQGTRLKLDVPKPLCPLRGRKLIDYVVDVSVVLGKRFAKSRIGAVVGHQRELVEEHLRTVHKSQSIDFAHQKMQLGTADAVRAYVDQCSWSKETDWTLIVCADTPCLDAELLFEAIDHTRSKRLQGCALSFKADTPKGYGRIVRGEKGFRIVEEKDASSEEKLITEVNSGVYFVQTSYLLEKLKSVDSKNKSGEFYLTDIFSIGSDVEALLLGDEKIFLGVNDLVQLAEANGILNRRKCMALMRSGVIIPTPETVHIDDEVEVGPESVIGSGSHLYGTTKLGRRVEIEPHCMIKSSQLDDGATLLAYSYLEQAHVGSRATVGPFARLRPGADLREKVKVGNFVEIKKAVLHAEAKVSHLSYVGDAEIGERSNIGCGFITCNYDGANKHFTKVGKDVFIGSDSQAVAPVEIGDGSFVACSSTITHSVEPGSFVISRGKQVTKPGMAKRFLKSKDS